MDLALEGAEAVNEPATPLAEICERYFGLCYPEARRAAALNQLPVPTFRLRDSQKAPLLVKAEDLQTYIDTKRNEAAVEWERSNT